jgi:lipopolysaccharide export system protein LptA
MALAVAALLLAAAAWAPPAARAQAIDLSSGGPVTVTALGGFEWRENQQVVIATGDARAVRGDVTVLADTLIAHYRKKGTGPGEAASGKAASGGAVGPATPVPPRAAPPLSGSPGATQSAAGGDPDSGGNEVYRLEADGHVRILTPTDEAVGDHAIYDIDQAVLVMTGHAMKVTTPTYVMTARDSMEYWSQRHMAVGRGNAVVVTNDARRLAGDVLVGYTTDPNAPPAPGAQPVAVKPVAAKSVAAKPGADPLTSSGKLERVEAFGNVEVRTLVDTVRGDRGVYVPDTGIARVVGHVRITRGENQINGPAADVNMKTGIAHMLSQPGQRVQGLIVPNATQTDTGLPAAKPATGPKAGAP